MAPTAQGWGAVAASSAGALVISRTLGVAGHIPVGTWFNAWKEEMRRLSALPMRLLPAPKPAVIPAGE